MAHYTLDHDLSLKEAPLKLNFVSNEAFDKAMDPKGMVDPYVAKNKRDSSMKEKKITLLVIDDSEDDRALYKRLLRKNTHISTILEAMTVQQGLDLYHENNIDCVLIDYQLPGEDGISFINKAMNLPHPFVPLIMLTGQGNEKVAVAAMKAGASDYLTKDELTDQLLNKTIQHVLEKSKLVSELNKKTIALEVMATTDNLTGLLNRHAFQKEAQKRVSFAKRHDQKIVILFIDLDGFKNINDTYGHETGDRLLSLAAERLARSFREEDIVCRFGGDEFVAVCRVCLHSDAVNIAKKIISMLSEPYVFNGSALQINACVGIAYRQANEGLEDLIHEADQALYAAKRSGKGKYFISTKSA